MLKKLFAALLCLILCVGCGGQIVAQSTDITFQFSFQSGGENFLVEAAVGSAGDMEFTVRQPDNINELRLNFSDDTVHTEFLGLNQDLPLSTTNFGILEDIYTAFSGLHNVAAERQGDEYIAAFSADGNEYIFTLTDLGLPIRLSINGQKIEFNNIKAG